MIRPVTAHGTAAPGYRVSRALGDSVSCLGTNPHSRVAVSNNIDECSPSALYPVACWAGPTSKTTLCYRDPFAKQVVLLSASKPLPAATAPRVPSPIGLVLSDGSRCTIRAGGAWAALQGHPGWYGTYGCANDKYALWGVGASDGVNRSGARWTVQESAFNGRGPVRTVTVATVYFVGTAG